MQTRREYAASLGLAKAGARGKFSNEAKAAIAKAEAEGMRFADSSTAPKATGNPTGTSDAPEVLGKTDPRDSAYILPSDYRFPEDEYRARGPKGETYGMRECCNACGVSLLNHACNEPTIHGNIPITIVRR